MERTYTQSVHYKIVIEGDYSCGNLWEEDLYEDAEEAHDNVWEHVAGHIIDYYHTADIELSDLKTTEEDYKGGNSDD